MTKIILEEIKIKYIHMYKDICMYSQRHVLYWQSNKYKSKYKGIPDICVIFKNSSQAIFWKLDTSN